MFNWFHFLTYAFITAVTPGPNNIMSMSNAVRFGFKKSFAFNLGIFAGFSVVMLLCTIFCALLSYVIPRIKLPMLIIGALYMLYLAWHTFRGGFEQKELITHKGFVSGMLLQFMNVKIIIYGIVSMETYILPSFSGQFTVLAGFALLLAFIGFVFSLCWAAFGSLFQALFVKYATVTNTIMALLLVFCSVSLFF